MNSLRRSLLALGLSIAGISLPVYIINWHVGANHHNEVLLSVLVANLLGYTQAKLEGKDDAWDASPGSSQE